MNRGNHVRWCNDNKETKKSRYGLIKETNWNKIQNELESGLYFRDDVANNNEITTGYISFGVERKYLDCSKWKLKKYKHNEKIKKELSIKKIKWCLNNKEKHLWSLRHKKSIPCNYFKELLIKENIVFYEEYIPLEDRMFAIDIAFPDRKLGIEINGNQHYENNGTLKKYYQDRHNLIEQNGWKLFEFHYSWVYQKNIIEQIKKILDGYEVKYEFEIRKKKTIKHDIRKIYFDNVRKNNENILRPKIELLLTSDIDFSKFGWVEKASKITGIIQQKITRYMKRYIPEFYEEKCFKKRIKIGPVFQRIE